MIGSKGETVRFRLNKSRNIIFCLFFLKYQVVFSLTTWHQGEGHSHSREHLIGQIFVYSLALVHTR